MRTTVKTLALPLGLAVALTAGAAGAAQTTLPKDLPPYGQDKPLPVPAITQKTLDNGLTVWVLPRTDGPPKVDVVLAVRGGKASDPADLPAMSDLLASLLTEGTRTRSAIQIAEQLQAIGASIDATAGNDGITVSGSGLASGAERLVGLLADVGINASFPDAEVKLAKANALQALKAAEAQPSYQASRAIARAIYGDHPYGRTLATEASIGKTERAALAAAHTARFRPDRALLVVSGRIDAATALTYANGAFGAWKAQGEAPAEIAAAPREAKPQHVLVERSGSVQSAVRLGRPVFAANDADEIPAALANTILGGGGLDTRLNRNLREDKGYTYGAYSSFSVARRGGAFTSGADVRNEVTGAAVGEFVKELQKLIDTPVDAAELERAKRAAAGGYLFRNQLQSAVARSLAANWLVGRPPEYLGQFVPRTREVTAEQVQTMARRYFDPKTLSIVVVGDKAVAEQLGAYGSFGATPAGD